MGAPPAGIQPAQGGALPALAVYAVFFAHFGLPAIRDSTWSPSVLLQPAENSEDRRVGKLLIIDADS